jgi:hypothetical protein
MRKNEPTLAEALGQAHDALLEDLRRLEESASPASPTGLMGLRSRLQVTRKHLADHFRFEEQNGYMDTVRKREPRLEHAVQQLAEQHKELAHRLDELIAQAASASGLSTALGDGVRDWVRNVRQHELRENDLVQDAFETDLGPED